MKIAILSDTHGLLRPQVLDRLAGVDAILHAGDIDTPAVLERLEDFAPVYAVRGNNDWAWTAGLPRTRTISLAGVTFFLVHIRRDVPQHLVDVDVVVYGHSHRYACGGADGMLWLNPGSCGRRRPGHEITLAIMEAENGAFQVERIQITPEER